MSVRTIEVFGLGRGIWIAIFGGKAWCTGCIHRDRLEFLGCALLMRLHSVVVIFKRTLVHKRNCIYLCSILRRP